LAGSTRRERLYAGGRSGGGAESDWDLKRLYQSLAAAYNWTYSQIDSHTLAEVKELFDGWEEYPPLGLLVKAIAEGLGGGKLKSVPGSSEVEANLENIRARAGPALPVISGRDIGLPKNAPVFDLETLRKRNTERIIANVKRDLKR
jgi:hypothetical protein